MHRSAATLCTLTFAVVGKISFENRPREGDILHFLRDVREPMCGPLLVITVRCCWDVVVLHV